MPNFRFTRICRKIVDVAIYALYLESFCGVNLAIRKVFAFFYYGVTSSDRTMIRRPWLSSETEKEEKFKKKSK